MIILSILIIFILINKTTMAESQPEVTTLQLSTEEGVRVIFCKLYMKLVDHFPDISALDKPSPYLAYVRLSASKVCCILLSIFAIFRMNTNELPSKLPSKFTQCYLNAQEVPAMAKCVTKLLQNKFDAQKKSKDVAESERFQKYKTGQTSDGNDEKQAWIGQFRVKKDEFRKEKG